jgi:hypothetical protein
VKFTLYISLLLFFVQIIGCRPPAEALDQETDAVACESGLKMLWRNDTIPLQPHDVLQEMLPEKWGPAMGMTNIHKSGGMHPGNIYQFSEARLHLESTFNFYFEYILRDYAQDSSSIMYIWQEYLAAARGESPNPRVVHVRQLGGCSDAFVWEWYDGNVRSLEALLHGRYHLTLTDHTSTENAEEAFKMLKKGWNKIPWKKWGQLGVEPVVYSL